MVHRRRRLRPGTEGRLRRLLAGRGPGGRRGRAGVFLTAEIAGEPVLVVRDEAGVLRAFANVCRHRGPGGDEPCGKASRLRCRYHGWTYDLAGRLCGRPEFDGVADFRREDNGLPPLAVADWGPIVWVAWRRPAADAGQLPRPAARSRLPPVAGSASFVARREYDVACNWKVYVDNYLDGGYHVHTIHPGLAGVLDYAHYRTEIHGWTSVQISPLKPADPADATARTRTGDTAQYWWVYPNFMVNLYRASWTRTWSCRSAPTAAASSSISTSRRRKGRKLSSATAWRWRTASSRKTCKYVNRCSAG